MVKQVEDTAKPQISQLEDLLNYIYEYENKDIDVVFDVVKFADNMILNRTGFPITHCGAGITSFSILPNGDVYTCVKQEKEEHKITNLLLDQAVFDIKINKFKIIDNDLVMHKKECKGCDLKYHCGGGCRAEESFGGICKYNCSYFLFAKEFYLSKILEKHTC